MMPFADRYVDSYGKVSDDLGLRHVEWYEEPETRENAEEIAQRRIERRSSVQSLAAWLSALIHPLSVPQVGQRHA